MKNNNSRKDKKLEEILRQAGQQPLPEGFDKRFWRRFELEKDLPIPGNPWLGLPVNRAAIPSLVGILMLVLGLALSTPQDRPSVNVMVGEVSVVHKNREGQSQPLELHQKLQTGDRIKVSKSGWVLIELAKGYRIKINPDSEISIGGLKRRYFPGKTTFDLSKGQALVSIGDELKRKYPVEVRTANAFARAIGTQFVVAAPSAGNPYSNISVLKGTVKVGLAQNKSDETPSLLVHHGNEISVSDGFLPLEPQKMLEKRRQELEELFQFSKKNRIILLISMSPMRARELLSPCMIYFRIEADQVIAEKLKNIAINIQEASEDQAIEKHLEAAQALEEAIENQTELDRVPVLLFVGAYYSYLKQYEEALRVFENISLKYPNSHFSSLSLMAAVILYDEKLHSPAKAVSLAHEILKKYPQSYEASEAASLIKQNPT